MQYNISSPSNPSIKLNELTIVVMAKIVNIVKKYLLFKKSGTNSKEVKILTSLKKYTHTDKDNIWYKNLNAGLILILKSSKNPGNEQITEVRIIKFK